MQLAPGGVAGAVALTTGDCELLSSTVKSFWPAGAWALKTKDADGNEYVTRMRFENRFEVH